MNKSLKSVRPSILIVCLALGGVASLATDARANNCCQGAGWCAWNMDFDADDCTRVGGAYFADSECNAAMVCVAKGGGLGGADTCAVGGVAVPNIEEHACVILSGIPATSEWGLSALALTVLVAGTLYLRRFGVARA